MVVGLLADDGCGDGDLSLACLLQTVRGHLGDDDADAGDAERLEGLGDVLEALRHATAWPTGYGAMGMDYAFGQGGKHGRDGGPSRDAAAVDVLLCLADGGGLTAAPSWKGPVTKLGPPGVDTTTWIAPAESAWLKMVSVTVPPFIAV